MGSGRVVVVVVAVVAVVVVAVAVAVALAVVVVVVVAVGAVLLRPTSAKALSAPKLTSFVLPYACALIRWIHADSDDHNLRSTSEVF